MRCEELNATPYFIKQHEFEQTYRNPFIFKQISYAIGEILKEEQRRKKLERRIHAEATVELGVAAAVVVIAAGDIFGRGFRLWLEEAQGPRRATEHDAH